MPVSTSLHPDGSQERPVSLASTASSSGSSRDSRSAMEEPSGPEAPARNGAGSPRGRHPPNSNNNSSGRPAKKGPLSPFSGRAAAAPAHKLSYLGRVVREIVETERMYVQDLRSIVEDYLLKIIDTPGLLQPEQVSALFGNIESIYALNSQLLRDLDSCNSDPVAVASCFVERSKEFDIYTQYCNNYPNSVAALTECMRDKQQAKFFRDRQALLQHSLPLGSYLLKPVQRILKYHLLLQEIAKHFGEEEDGFEVVENAIDTMTCVAWYINDMKRRHEHAVRLQEIQSLLINWKGPDLTIYGELVLEGTFRLHRVRSEKTFFLFDKALLITKKRGDHFVYKGHIPCSSLMLIESTRDSLCFTVTHYKHSKQQYSIQAKTVQEKRNWTHHIKRLILENHHTTIPQKAKEAILEMDSYYPNRYRYSPERLKKAWSSQDEAPSHARQGRRQSEPGQPPHSRAALPSQQRGLTVPGLAGRRKSEPTKHLLRQLSEKATRAARGMKHAGSAGVLLDCGQPPRTRGLPPEPEGAAREEQEQEQEEEEVEEEEDEEEQAFRVTLEDLAGHEGSKKGSGPEPPGSEEEEEEEEEESLAVAEQGKGRRESEGAKSCRRPSGWSPTRAEKRMSFESISSLPEVEPDPEAGAEQEVFAAEEGPSAEEMPSDTESPEVLETRLDAHGEPLGLGPPSDVVDCTAAESTEGMKALSSEEEEEEEPPAALGAGPGQRHRRAVRRRLLPAEQPGPGGRQVRRLRDPAAGQPERQRAQPGGQREGPGPRRRQHLGRPRRPAAPRSGPRGGGGPGERPFCQWDGAPGPGLPRGGRQALLQEEGVHAVHPGPAAAGQNQELLRERGAPRRGLQRAAPREPVLHPQGPGAELRLQVQQPPRAGPGAGGPRGPQETGGLQAGLLGPVRPPRTRPGGRGRGGPRPGHGRRVPPVLGDAEGLGGDGVFRGQSPEGPRPAPGQRLRPAGAALHPGGARAGGHHRGAGPRLPRERLAPRAARPGPPGPGAEGAGEGAERRLPGGAGRPAAPLPPAALPHDGWPRERAGQEQGLPAGPPVQPPHQEQSGAGPATAAVGGRGARRSPPAGGGRKAIGWQRQEASAVPGPGAAAGPGAQPAPAALRRGGLAAAALLLQPPRRRLQGLLPRGPALRPQPPQPPGHRDLPLARRARALLPVRLAGRGGPGRGRPAPGPARQPELLGAQHGGARAAGQAGPLPQPEGQAGPPGGRPAPAPAPRGAAPQPAGRGRGPARHCGPHPGGQPAGDRLGEGAPARPPRRTRLAGSPGRAGPGSAGVCGELAEGGGSQGPGGPEPARPCAKPEGEIPGLELRRLTLESGREWLLTGVSPWASQKAVQRVPSPAVTALAPPGLTGTFRSPSSCRPAWLLPLYIVLSDKKPNI